MDWTAGFIAHSVDLQAAHGEKRCAKCEVKRKCSRCGEEGHNARTCKAEFFRVPKRKSTVVGKIRCPTCGGSGVLPCLSCQSPMETRTPSVQDLCSLSKFKYKMRGHLKSEICKQCGGSSLVVCPQCTGMYSESSVEQPDKGSKRN
mmetsp:Transcript_9037/g.27168  ORF Transcript_9037/g.27168 Transcript_9037/m.27168 type:complete len:146 (+) Transcript_9037:149-586(+)